MPDEGNKLYYQIRLDVEEGLAKKIREKKSFDILPKLYEILKKYNADVVCQYDAFCNFLKECELEKNIDNPLYRWTKDTVLNQSKKSKYLKSFTIYVNNEQLYSKTVAEQIEKKLSDLNEKRIIKINKFNSDPKNNPQPPKKYF